MIISLMAVQYGKAMIEIVPQVSQPIALVGVRSFVYVSDMEVQKI